MSFKSTIAIAVTAAGLTGFGLGQLTQANERKVAADATANAAHPEALNASFKKTGRGLVAVMIANHQCFIGLENGLPTNKARTAPLACLSK